MATQTEKLRQVLNSKLWILSRVKKVEQRHIDGFNKEILKACKEAGLRFVGNKGDVLFGEGIEI